MSKFFGRLAALLVVAYGLLLAGTVLFVLFYDGPDAVPSAETIVILSGPKGDEPNTAGETRIRTDAGVALWQAGAAPRIVMSGNGTGFRNDRPHALNMADRARELGVPQAVILVEDQSFSTLQNAWFTARLDGLDRTAPVILVSHRYHLPRAWASFYWAGFTDITLHAAETRADALSPYIAMEPVKWGFNTLRAAGAALAFALGAAPDQVVPWLR